KVTAQVCCLTSGWVNSSIRAGADDLFIPVDDAPVAGLSPGPRGGIVLEELREPVGAVEHGQARPAQQSSRRSQRVERRTELGRQGVQAAARRKRPRGAGNEQHRAARYQ